MTDWIYITHYSSTLQHCKCRYYKLLHSHKTVSIITIHSVFLILTHAQNRNIVPVIIWFLYSIEFLIHFKSLKMSFCNCAARNCKSIIKFAYYKQLIDSLNHKTYNQSCVLVELYWIAYWGYEIGSESGTQKIQIIKIWSNLYMLTHYLQGHKFKDAWKIFLQQVFYI